MNKKDTLKRICKMISSGEIPQEIYNKYLSKTQIGFMCYKDLCNYFNLDSKIADYKYASEKELDIANARADIMLALNNFCGNYDAISLIDTYIEQLEQDNEQLKKTLETMGLNPNKILYLEQENKELKEMYSKLEDKYSKNQPCCNEDDCALYKRCINNDYILTELEKWLEEEINTIEKTYSQINRNYMRMQPVLDTFKKIKLKLQELKDVDKQ